MSQHLQKIAENLSELTTHRVKPLVVVIDDDNNYITHSGSLSKFHLPPFEVGMNCIEFLPFLVGIEEEAYVVLPMLNYAHSRTANVNVIKINANRYVVMVDTSDEYQHQQSLTQNANETKLLNHQLTQLTLQLSQAQSELKDKNEMLKVANETKSRFISAMSHEFRTPISSILGYSNVLEREFSSDEAGFLYTKAIERNTKFLLSLIDNVLEHAQLEEDKPVINILPIPIRGVIEDIELMFDSQAEQKSLFFSVEHGKNLPDVIYTDATRLLQILINLVSNSFKYTDHGSVKVKFDWHQDLLTVLVTDTGPGIPKKFQQSIFQAYSRYAAEDKQGIGLGLSISSKLAKKLGGELQLDADYKNGSQFILKIQAKQAAFSKTKSFDSKGKKVLIVEDDEDLVKLLKIYIEDSGHTTAIASDGIEALQYFKNEYIDLVLLDMKLPKLRGVEVAKKIIASGSKIPIIGMTASSNNVDKMEALEAGCKEFLIKPIQPTPLISAIERVFQAHG